ncbi:hypothetical protein ACW4YW_15075 [Methylobacillus pratensis]
MVKAVALESFTHDSLNVRRGDDLDIAESTARDLEKHGLVKVSEVKSAPTSQNKKAPVAQNKTQTDSNSTKAD